MHKKIKLYTEKYVVFLVIIHVFGYEIKIIHKKC